MSYKSLHLHWDCVLRNSSLLMPIMTCALIDIGCHLILIYPSLVQHLKLHYHPLGKPKYITVTVDTIQKISLAEFVYITPTSQCNTFVSCCVKALITPYLCSKLLLGLLFLITNDIIIDSVAHSVTLH